MFNTSDKNGRLTVDILFRRMNCALLPHRLVAGFVSRFTPPPITPIPLALAFSELLRCTHYYRHWSNANDQLLPLIKPIALHTHD
ncbi:hypothetical protein TDB9533_01088 [Thalassocella blandensis]|nr:hypothetical protein TDB9533_01088 [Thalassocella blandensis]